MLRDPVRGVRAGQDGVVGGRREREKSLVRGADCHELE